MEHFQGCQMQNFEKQFFLNFCILIRPNAEGGMLFILEYKKEDGLRKHFLSGFSLQKSIFYQEFQFSVFHSSLLGKENHHSMGFFFPPSNY